MGATRPLRYEIGFACDGAEPMQRTLDELYAYGDDLPTRVLHRCRLNLFVRLVERLRRRGLLRQGGAALDIGCNAGLYSALLSDFGFERVLGIDVVPSMIETARRHFASDEPGRSVEFRLVRAEDLPAEPAWDCILCTEVIEHTDDPGRVVENIRAMIAPGGVAIVSLPNRISLPYLAAWAAHRLRRRPRNADFERHLEFPFTRSMGLFTGGDRRLVATDGTNLVWEDRLLRALHGRPGFAWMNRAQFELGRLWPFRFLTQFFYVVVRRD